MHEIIPAFILSRRYATKAASRASCNAKRRMTEEYAAPMVMKTLDSWRTDSDGV